MSTQISTKSPKTEAEEVKVSAGEGEVKEGAVCSEEEEVETGGEEEATWATITMTTTTTTTGTWTTGTAVEEVMDQDQ